MTAQDSSRQFDLSPAEVELLIKACTKYRATIPVYLQSSQQEAKVVDDLLSRFRKSLAEDEPDLDDTADQDE